MSVPDVVHKQYTAVPGSHFTDEDAQVIGPFVDGLMEQLGRKATTEEILAAAEPEVSPIHTYFNWDDSSAARQYRLYQARQVAGSYQITLVEVPTHGVFPVRGTVNLVVGDGEKTRTYIPVQDSLTNPAYLEQIMVRADGHLLTWMKTYRFYRQSPLFESRFRRVFALLEKLFPEA